MNPARQRGRGHVVMVLATALALSACTPPVLAPPPAAPVIDAGSALVVLLTWAGAADLDLYVTDPSWETVYFGNNPSRSGARLERDEKCRADGGDAARVEVVRVPRVADGTYRVGVDFIDACGSALKEVSYRVVADFHGDRREITGVATPNVFAPIVLELRVQQETLM